MAYGLWLMAYALWLSSQSSGASLLTRCRNASISALVTDPTLPQPITRSSTLLTPMIYADVPVKNTSSAMKTSSSLKRCCSTV